MARTVGFELELDTGFYYVSGELTYEVINGLNDYDFEPVTITCRASGMTINLDRLIDKEVESTGEYTWQVIRGLREQMLDAALAAAKHL